MEATEWLDRDLYPFLPHQLATADGTIHYIDEGEGDVVVLVHGTPTWSFLYRDLIRELSRDHRVVALDHLGFGLSEKPPGAGYRPQDHAARLGAFLDSLGLKEFTLVVHDFGGPIGLSEAIERPERVRALVLMNTWMWSLAGTSAERAGRFFAGPIGRFLYTRLNFSPRFLVPAGFGDRARLTKAIHRHYLAPFGKAADREGPWAFARALAESGAWFESLWNRRARLREKPTAILWGMKDTLLGAEYLERWRAGLPGAEVTEFAAAGHFVPEEVDAGEIAARIRAIEGEAKRGARMENGTRLS